MQRAVEARLRAELEQFQRDGVYKRLNYLGSPQSARVLMEGRGEVLIFSSNNYLGLSAEPSVVKAGRSVTSLSLCLAAFPVEAAADREPEHARPKTRKPSSYYRFWICTGELHRS